MVALGAATILCGVGLMTTAGYLISRAAQHPAVLSLTAAIVGVRFFGLTRPIARYLERVQSHDLALRVLGGVRLRVYRQLEPLAPAQLRRLRQGDLLARIVADVDALQGLHLRGVTPPLVAVTASLCSLAVAATVAPWSAAVLAAGLLVAGLVGADAGRGAGGPQRAAAGGARPAGCRPNWWSCCPPRRSWSSTAAAISGWGGWRAADRELSDIDRRSAIAEGAGDGLRMLVSGATICGVLAVAVSAHASGRLDAVLIAALALLALASFEAVVPLTEVARELPATVAAGQRVLELCDRKPAVTDPARPRPPPASPYDLELRDVAVRYDASGPLVLDGLDLRLGAGDTLALTGASGAGKTTVTRLLLRFLDPCRGELLLSGCDLRGYRQQDVRAAIALAGQEAHLFSTSIRENVLLGRPAAEAEQLEDALEQAGIADWVRSLPQGWDTPVGEQGRAARGRPAPADHDRAGTAGGRTAVSAGRADRPSRPTLRGAPDGRRAGSRRRPLAARDHTPTGGARPARQGRAARGRARRQRRA